VTAREAFDQPQQRRNDALAPGAIDTAGHYECDPHALSIPAA
jgi:hypothetical protein